MGAPEIVKDCTIIINDLGLRAFHTGKNRKKAEVFCGRIIYYMFLFLGNFNVFTDLYLEKWAGIAQQCA